MTLAEWGEKHGCKPRQYRDTDVYTVPMMSGPEHAELFGLTDYFVSSVAGGSVWMCRRNVK